ncbi:hypothetical protein TRIUR3_05012 [Triticum urartu]|uniref:Uncharacterized protein n=2 Tax=Triticum TaxID=4564 RepID=A0A9R1R1C8_TRITD|nr:hypothetical protein TRIUR3_05012 [Triticum urartu]VAH24781.1 unnamed protein product [Triticum turgidum subsp. durum]
MQRPGEEICRLNLWDKGQVFAATENLQRSIEQTPYSIQADTIVCCFSLSRCQSESSSYAGYASSDGGDNPASSSAQQLHYPSHAHMDPGHVQLILPGSMTLLEDIFHNYEVTFGPGYKEILLQAFSANSDKLCRNIFTFLCISPMHNMLCRFSILTAVLLWGLTDQISQLSACVFVPKLETPGPPFSLWPHVSVLLVSVYVFSYFETPMYIT